MSENRLFEKEESEFLSNYDISKYDRPSVATDIAVFSMFDENFESHRKDAQPQLHILMIKRGEFPYKNRWALPGGFVGAKETVEECALREIKEETNLLPTAIMPIGVFSEPERDPRGRIISHAFASVVNNENEDIRSGSDAANAKWFRTEFECEQDVYTLKLTSDDEKTEIKLRKLETRFGHSRFECITESTLAFDHAQIIASALSALRREADNVEIVFDFLPERFTLSAMQKVQETLLGVSLLSANYRRKIADFVEETHEYTEGVGHRPARLFKRKNS